MFKLLNWKRTWKITDLVVKRNLIQFSLHEMSIIIKSKGSSLNQNKPNHQSLPFCFSFFLVVFLYLLYIYCFPLFLQRLFFLFTQTMGYQKNIYNNIASLLSTSLKTTASIINPVP